MPAEFEATAEDAAYATLTFKNGVVGQYIEDHGAWGQGSWLRQIHGSKGSMSLPGDRSGRLISLNIDGQETINDERLLSLVPDFHLDAVTTALFGTTGFGGMSSRLRRLMRKSSQLNTVILLKLSQVTAPLRLMRTKARARLLSLTPCLNPARLAKSSVWTRCWMNLSTPINVRLMRGWEFDTSYGQNSGSAHKKNEKPCMLWRNMVK